MQGEQYWQSDGSLPHVIRAQFARRHSLAEVALLVQYHPDESYTPRRLEVRVGALHHDLAVVRRIELPAEATPDGWVRIPLTHAGRRGPRRFTRASLLEVHATLMYSNGRDVHVRGVALLGPDEAGSGGSGGGGEAGGHAWANPVLGVGWDMR